MSVKYTDEPHDVATRDPLLLRVRDVSGLTGWSRSFIYQLFDRSELPFVAVGKTRRVRPEDLRALIERSRVAA